MMTYYEEFKRRCNAVGNEREYSLREAKREFEYMLVMMPNAEDVELYNVSGDMVETKVLVNDIRPVDDRIVDDKKFLFAPDIVVEVGFTIKYKDSYWICIVRETNTVDSHIPTRFRPCNHLTKWVDETGIIRSEWSVVSNKTLYSDGVRSTDVVEIPDQKAHIMLPMNEHTAKLGRDKRMILFDDSYSITNIDRMTAGLMQFILTETPLSVNDRIDLGIADYEVGRGYKIELLTPTTYEVSLDNNDTRILAKVLDEDGREVLDANVQYESSNVAIASIDEDGVITLNAEGVCQITLRYNDIEEKVFLNVTSTPFRGSNIIVRGSSQISVGSSSVYDVEVYRDNKPYVDTVSFELYRTDGQLLSEEIAIVSKIDGSTCSIRVVSDAVDEFNLKVSSTYAVEVKRVSVKSLFDF